MTNETRMVIAYPVEMLSLIWEEPYLIIERADGANTDGAQIRLGREEAIRLYAGLGEMIKRLTGG